MGGSFRSFAGRRALLLLLAPCVALLAPPSASALLARGHHFASAFGAPGSGAGELSNPGEVAVSEATGEVYVVDRGNKRIEIFAADGTSVGELAVRSPRAIAIDNSHAPGSPEDQSGGDIYVVSGSKLLKLSPTGSPLATLGGQAEEGAEDVAVDAAGNVWLKAGEEGEAEFLEFSDGEPNVEIGEEGFFSELEPLREGFAVDAHDHLFVIDEPAEAFEEEPHERPCEQAPCYLAELASVETGEVEAGGVLAGRLGAENTSGVAVDLLRSDLYADNLTSVAMLTPSGSLIQRFGEGHLAEGAGVAVDSATDTVYVADAVSGTVQVYAPEPPGPPAIDSLSAAKTTADSTELDAAVDPTGAATEVTFEYGVESCATSGTCTVLAAPNTGSGFGDETLSVTLSGLAPGTGYLFRVRARNSLGEATSAVEGTFTTQSSEAGSALLDGRAYELVSQPDKEGAGLEALTKEGGTIQASTDGSRITYVAIAPDEAEPEGNRSPEVTQLFSERHGSGGTASWQTDDITTPNDEAIGVLEGEPPEYQAFSSELTASIVNPRVTNPLLSPAASEATPYRRDDLACAPVPSSCYLPLVTGAEGFADVPPGTEFGAHRGVGGVKFLLATPELDAVVLLSQRPLTDEPAAPGPNLYEWRAGRLTLINVLPAGEGPASSAALGSGGDLDGALSEDGNRVVWSAGEHLYLTDMQRGETVLLDEVQEGGHTEGTSPALFQHAGTDGSHVLFTDESPLTASSRARFSEPDLFACDVHEHEGHLACRVTDLSVDSQSDGEVAAVRGAVLGASADGTSVYFAANGVLSTAANSRGATASAGDCVALEGASGGTCNVYVEHFDAGTEEWSAPSFIASVANADEPDWEIPRADHTARVSPDGRFLAFMSSRPLTGYDNSDIASAAADEEVFVYDDDGAALACASCNPTGARPTGVLDQEEVGEGLGLLIDRPEVWGFAGKDGWLSGSIPGWTAEGLSAAIYQSRYLSNSGRLFFNSSEALVSEDVNGKEDVYEYEPAGVGGCSGSQACVGLVSSGTSNHESAFLDASANGDDVFFLTSASLLGVDHDTNFDVYDARVCGGEGCILGTGGEAAGCESAEQCARHTVVTPGYGTPATMGAAGAGNAAGSGVLANKVKKLSRAEKLKKALHHCRVVHRRRKPRLACEKLARRHFGARGAAKRAPSSKHAPVSNEHTAVVPARRRPR